MRLCSKDHERGLFIAAVVGMIFWIVGGKEALAKIIKRFGELRDEKLRELTYGWNNFDIAEYREICKRLENKETK